MIELVVVGIRLDEETPVLLLRERSGERLLPIWISTVDAAAIAVAIEDEEFPRPLTQDLLAEALARLAGSTDPVATITAVEDGVFLAEIAAGEHTLDARPSDAVAVTLRRGWPLRCAAALLDQVGVPSQEDPPDEVELFREFLDQVQPEDF